MKIRFAVYTGFLSGAAVLILPAFGACAAEAGTYRPGTPYLTVQAVKAENCERQCYGDAQCRGWNYVKANPKAAGVCEFLSKLSTPIASPFSVSGEGHGAYAYQSKLTQGATHTVRVGQSAQPVAPSKLVQKSSTRQTAPRQISGRRVVREPLHAAQNNVHQATHRARSMPVQRPVQRPAITTQRQPARPSFQPLLDAEGGVAPTRSQPVRPVLNQPQQMPQPYQAHPQQGQPQQMPQQGQPQQMPQPYQARPPMSHPVSERRPRASNRRMTGPRSSNRRIERRQVNMPQNRAENRAQPQQLVPQQLQNPQPQAAQMERRPVSPNLAPISMPTQNLASAAQSEPVMALDPKQARRSLFGRLNDDVSAPSTLTSTPNGDSPIATAASRPTTPVSETPLGGVTGGGPLAGAAR